MLAELPHTMSRPAPWPPGPVPAARTAPPEPRWAAGQIALRIADRQVLAAALLKFDGPAAGPLAWRPSSLAQGYAGLAVLCAELDAAQPGAGWDLAGHRHLDAAAADVSWHDGSLFSGLAGLGFAAALLAAGRPRYERLLRQVDEALEPQLDAALGRLAGASGCRVGDFDLVSGLTGIGAYLLTRGQLGPAPAATGDMASPAVAGCHAAALTETMLDRLLRGLARLMADPSTPRPWHTPAALASRLLRREYPAGLHNCGLAHGAPGPLALLSLAALADRQVPSLMTAIDATASWLAAHHTGTAEEPDWPDGVPLDAAGEAPTRRSGVPGRAAWCYGAPGVARSLWLAGAAAGEPRWQELAARAIRAVAARPAPAWCLATPAFCHGEAGLLQVLRRFAADLGDPVVAAAAQRLAAGLAAGFDPGTLLGVRSLDPDGVPVDQPGLLDGAAGIALALLGLPAARPGSATGAGPGWDRMFLLA
jgi:lantibiotic biosynthesis protein